MRLQQLFFSALLSITLLGCDDDQVSLDKNDEQIFEGSFQVLKDEKEVVEDSGLITLHIKDGHYHGATDQSYGNFAGKLEITFNRINFIDTLFKIYPANIIPPWVPQGKYTYTFDGEQLTFKKTLDSGAIEQYTLNLQD